MSKETKESTSSKTSTYSTLKAMYFSGKVKPSLNKILVELKNDSENLDLTLLACQCLLRAKDYDKLADFADASIELNTENGDGYYYKGMAFRNTKGKEQEALQNFDKALTIDPDNTLYLHGKATTHLSLFTDFHLPIKLAEKHRAKGEESLMKVISLIEEKENPDFKEYLTIGDVSITVSKNLDAKMYYIKAVNAFEAAADDDKDMNVYKDIVKSQNACNKLMKKFIE